MWAMCERKNQEFAVKLDFLNKKHFIFTSSFSLSVGFESLVSRWHCSCLPMWSHARHHTKQALLLPLQSTYYSYTFFLITHSIKYWELAIFSYLLFIFSVQYEYVECRAVCMWVSLLRIVVLAEIPSAIKVELCVHEVFNRNEKRG